MNQHVPLKGGSHARMAKLISRPVVWQVSQIFVPKYRRDVIYGQLQQHIGPILWGLLQQQGIELVEGHAMPDHVPLCLSIPPQYSAANTVGFLKGKLAIRIHREFLGRSGILLYYSP